MFGSLEKEKSREKWIKLFGIPNITKKRNKEK